MSKRRATVRVRLFARGLRDPSLIVYEVSSGGTALNFAENLEIQYLDDSGQLATQDATGPAWRSDIATKPGQEQAVLSASVPVGLGEPIYGKQTAGAVSR
jgi:hypothetical protein